MFDLSQLSIEVVGGLLVLALMAVGAGLWRIAQDAIDRGKIIKLLERMKRDRGFNFLSTHAIASATKLSPARIERLCQTHSRVRRNQKERESWTLID